MNDVVWVALISAGAALVTALVTQLLATRAAGKSADRAEKREALQWQRTEALRLEEFQRKEAQRREELQNARLRELWGYVLTVRWQVLDALQRMPVKGQPAPKSAPVSAEAMPAHAAGQAYSVALTGLAAVRPSAKAFYIATASVQQELLAFDDDAMHVASAAWKDAYEALEMSVAALADGLVRDTTAGTLTPQ
ncbi:hypothetical protein [Acidovorax sp. BLS4]|uniref:hypothetical protein n=1 Tax=Acidovorax sp. BLS4 TaxID=3273430 RepID=UPI00294335C6|nr:hypothetical protein [Paracidovorax avenae]WOI47727.1 hypothetical protein R1Z03_11140 [Paracidovorax avenae]